MKQRIFIAILASIICIAALKWQGASLKTTGSPRAIVELELATSPQQVQSLLGIWDIAVVKLNIWIDFAFIVAYVAFLALSSEAFANKWNNSLMKSIGFTLARIAFVAGVLDIAENLFMLQTIAGNYSLLSLQLTHYCASIKFTLAGIVLLYLLVSLPILLRKK
jgi:hypothetical protein